MPTSHNGAPRACDYEITIHGRVGESLRLAFEELSVTLHPAETVLRGRALDQAALYGILDRIQALGFELVEVRRLPS
ncbi:hypothetical protein BZB76_5517 [Actinomadura pelletieri DSM 43383]|uniref:Uncharacterized protein n=1 Tax=Actinomadura pelletieri DSM 43383 TaxID=1120940 RepID=A0A495QGN6_9ACTN|nr:hypothetical protein [Actinomadura pelletieri]RKS71035.1 hypothetical protein BZB76_5517 [Actinomadura pelletieri DSM 43383]